MFSLSLLRKVRYATCVIYHSRSNSSNIFPESTAHLPLPTGQEFLSLVFGLWSLVLPVVHRLWPVVCGLWSLVYGRSSSVVSR